MKVALSVCSLRERFLRGELNNVSFLKYAASLGVEGVELCDQYGEVGFGELDEIRQVLAKTRLEVACYALTSNFEDIEIIKQGLATALQLGSSCLRLQGDQSSPKQVMQVVSRLLPYIEEAEVTVCLEHNGLATALDSPYIKSTFAMADSVLAGERPTSSIGHVLASDLRLADSHEESHSVLGADGRHYVGSVLGLGLVPVQDLVRTLWEQNYKGWIAVDFAGLENPLFGIEASLKNLRQYLREL